jgi:hypothetical protein
LSFLIILNSVSIYTCNCFILIVTFSFSCHLFQTGLIPSVSPVVAFHCHQVKLYKTRQIIISIIIEIFLPGTQPLSINPSMPFQCFFSVLFYLLYLFQPS